MCGCPTVRVGKNRWGKVHTSQCRLSNHLETKLPEREAKREARI